MAILFLKAESPGYSVPASGLKVSIPCYLLQTDMLICYLASELSWDDTAYDPETGEKYPDGDDKTTAPKVKDVFEPQGLAPGQDKSEGV
jgi:hypothetical protein